MRTRFSLSVIATSALVAAGIAAIAAAQTLAPAAPAAQTANPQPAPSDAGLLKVRTRLVDLDVIATDSHGNVIRDLKQQDLQVFEEHDNEQKIARFGFVAGPATGGQPGPGASRGGERPAFYSNQLPLESLTVPPTVLLMDGLNTDVPNQMYARSQMVRLLKTLPSETPIAVFLLGNSLRLLQGFTTDPALLRSAVDKALNPQFAEQNPIDDAHSVSNTLMDEAETDDLISADMIQQMQDFEKEEYASTMDTRVTTTIESLNSIGHYLSGIPGRKNLVWISQSFPISLVPDLNSGKNEFFGTRQYGEQVEMTANTLSDAQVAVYPVDAGGLATNQSLSASENVRVRNGQSPGCNIRARSTCNSPGDGGLSSRVDREESLRFQSQGTMKELAQDTGGKTCTNVNDLSSCVNMALRDGSSYYEVGFYPQNINWDGKFHKVVVKTSRSGVKLSYRRGYYALDLAAIAKKQNPERELRDACGGLLPATSIRLVAFPGAPREPSDPPGRLNYQLMIAPADVTLAQEGGARNLSMEVATCVFGSKMNSYSFSTQDIDMEVSDDALRSWQSTGIPDRLAVSPAQDTQRVRFVVLDLPSGVSGAVDVPIRPQDIDAVKQPPPPAPPANVTAPAMVDIPDKGSPALVADTLKFSVPSGHTGSLNWKADALVYAGDLPLAASAPAFFNYAFGAKFRCQSAKLISVDPAGGEAKLQATFRTQNGKQTTVDLKGAQPEYSGDLAIDSSAKEFFDQVWKLAHCQ
jgi:VWFA-related protein